MAHLFGFDQWKKLNENQLILKLGSTGDRVKEIQKKLGLPETGSYDDATRTAVINFQKDPKNLDARGKRLIVDGIIGPRTREALFPAQKNIATPTQNTGDFQRTPSLGGVDVILMGGLDYRAGDYKITDQVALLKNNLKNKNIVGYRYTEIDKVLAAVSANPEAKVVLFSAGGTYSSRVASAMKNKGNLYIVEPYAASAGTKKSVQDAVSAGVPQKNVVAGSSSGRGAGAVMGATSTPSGMGHWGALQWVGTIIS